MGNLIDFEFSSQDYEDFKKNKCDKIDRMLAIACGTVAGFVDSFLVGMPGNSKLGELSDKMADKMVVAFAKKMGWKPHNKNGNNTVAAIDWLEKKYDVNYDQKTTKETGIAGLSAGNHHLKSLSHSPDVIGLFFSLLDQFTNTSSFVSDGEIIIIKTGNGNLPGSSCGFSYRLQGKSILSKLFCGTVNWLGHLMSDVAGSSVTRRNNANSRGTGLSAPFFNLFQLCDFGKIEGENGSSYTIADFSEKLFEKGYDARFYAAMKVPVLICNLLTKVCWFIKKHFYEKAPLKDCIKGAIFSTFAPESLRMMLLWSHGTLCAIDIVDAGIRSHGDNLTFFLHINLAAWYKMANLTFRELCIRLKLNTIEIAVDIIAEFNQEITQYLELLKNINYEQWKKDSLEVEEIANQISSASSEEEITIVLVDSLKRLSVTVPWNGENSFEEALENNSFVLKFE